MSAPQVQPFSDPEAWGLAHEAFARAPETSRGIKGDIREIGLFLKVGEWGKAEHLCNKNIVLVKGHPALSSFFYKCLALALERQNKPHEAQEAANRAAALREQSQKVSELPEDTFTHGPSGIKEVDEVVQNIGRLFLSGEWEQAEQVCRAQLALVEGDEKLTAIYTRYLTTALEAQKALKAEDAASRSTALSASSSASSSSSSSSSASASATTSAEDVTLAPKKRESAQEVMQQLEELFTNQDWEKAEKFCKQWLDRVRAWNEPLLNKGLYERLANAFVMQGKFIDAVEMANKAMEWKVEDQSLDGPLNASLAKVLAYAKQELEDPQSDSK